VDGTQDGYDSLEACREQKERGYSKSSAFSCYFEFCYGETLPMNTNPMNYLFAAYLAIWIILSLYLFSIHSREKKLREEVHRLRQIIEKADGKRI
jgi:CcmD family protein